MAGASLARGARKLVVAIALCAVAAPTGSASASGSAPRSASVTFVTRGRIYLDVGREDGVELGMAVDIFRKRRKITVCKLDGVADHRSTCPDPTHAVRANDRVRLERTTHVAATRTSSIGPQIGATAPVRLDGFAFEKVEHARTSAFGGGRAIRGGASLSYAFSARDGSSAAYNAAEVEAWVSHLPLAIGPLEGSLHVRARARPTRSKDTRFRVDVPAELYVLDASIGARPREGGYSFAVGRVGSYRVLGLRIFDGGVAGLRLADDEVELGGFAGLLPDAISLAPSTARYSGGAYWRARHALGSTTLSHEGRLALLGARDSPTIIDAEVSAVIDVPSIITLHGGGRVGVLTGDGGGAHLVSVTVDAMSEPLPRHLELRASFRERRQTSLPDYDLDAASLSGTWAPQDTRHVFAEANLGDAGSWMVAIRGGFGEVFGAERVQRAFAGPELSLPALFGTGGGLLVGYQESFGWSSGRSVYLQSTVTPSERVRVQARVSAYFDHDDLADAWRQELGVYLRGAFALTDWLDVRLLTIAHATLFDPFGAAISPGFVAQGTLTGSL